jgi:hypothetical protein
MLMGLFGSLIGLEQNGFDDEVEGEEMLTFNDFSDIRVACGGKSGELIADAAAFFRRLFRFIPIFSYRDCAKASSRCIYGTRHGP